MGNLRNKGKGFSTVRPASGKDGVIGTGGEKTIRSRKRRQDDAGVGFETFSSANAVIADDLPAGPQESPEIPVEAVNSGPISLTPPPEIISITDTAVPEFTENWFARNGHTFTYAGIFLFTLVLYFRPYELIPALSGLDSIALFFAVVTLLIYVPSQLSVENNLSALPLEVKCVLFMVVSALMSMVLARSPGLAWDTFNDTYIKVVLMFIVMVNTLRTEARIRGLIWLGIGIGIMLSWQAVDLYQQGVFKTEGYRVSVDFGGMFGNPNDMSVHLVMFIPLAVALGASSRNWLPKLLCFAGAAIMAAGAFVTQSRGAFLGMMAVGFVLVWKLGRKQRFKAMLIASVVGIIVILLAPGNYGLRVLSIFIPGLDPVGSADQRTELLIRSIWVTLRNPLGIGIGNFEIVGNQNLGTHNAYTQVSSELGWFAFIAYITLLLSPLRKLDVMERHLFLNDQRTSLYFLSIGLQASLVGFMVSSFFSSVAYHWYVYYPIAFAIGLRRIYQLSIEEKGETEDLSAGAMPVPQQA